MSKKDTLDDMDTLALTFTHLNEPEMSEMVRGWIVEYKSLAEQAALAVQLADTLQLINDDEKLADAMEPLSVCELR